MTMFAFENLEESRQRRLFSSLGVEYFATSRAWLNPPLMALFGIVAAFLLGPPDQDLSRILVGFGYGLLIMISMFCHGFGHTVSSRLINAPMTSILITATVNVTHFEDREEPASRVHVGRSLGGPALNLLLGMMAIVVYLSATESHFLLFFGSVNLLFGAGTLLPIPSLDGAVILRELRDWKR